MARHTDRHLSYVETGRLTLTVRVDEDGGKVFGIDIDTEEGERTEFYDVCALLGFAQATIADPRWQNDVYEDIDG